MESQYTDVQYVSIFTEITHTHSHFEKNLSKSKIFPFKIFSKIPQERGVEEESENAIESILEILFIDPDRIIITLLL